MGFLRYKKKNPTIDELVYSFLKGFEKGGTGTSGSGQKSDVDMGMIAQFTGGGVKKIKKGKTIQDLFLAQGGMLHKKFFERKGQ